MLVRDCSLGLEVVHLVGVYAGVGEGVGDWILRLPPTIGSIMLISTMGSLKVSIFASGERGVLW